MSGHLCTHLKFKVKPVSPANTGYILKVIFFSGLFCIAETVLHIQFYNLLFYSLNGTAEAFPQVFINSLQTSLLILRNNLWSECSTGHLTFPPFIGHLNCFLAMTIAVLKEAVCGLVKRKGEG